MEWPPQQTTRFGSKRARSTRALRRMSNTAWVMPLESLRLNSPDSSLVDSYTMSRTTANSSSLVPRMILPSTNACAGAFLRSSFTPRSCCNTWMSKSGYWSSIARALSCIAPDVNTASAQERSSACNPDDVASRRRAISSRDSTSSVPAGTIWAFTVAGRVRAGLALSCMRDAPFEAAIVRSQAMDGRSDDLRAEVLEPSGSFARAAITDDRTNISSTRFQISLDATQDHLRRQRDQQHAHHAFHRREHAFAQQFEQPRRTQQDRRGGEPCDQQRQAPFHLAAGLCAGRQQERRHRGRS